MNLLPVVGVLLVLGILEILGVVRVVSMVAVRVAKSTRVANFIGVVGSVRDLSSRSAMSAVRIMAGTLRMRVVGIMRVAIIDTVLKTVTADVIVVTVLLEGSQTGAAIELGATAALLIAEMLAGIGSKQAWNDTVKLLILGQNMTRWHTDVLSVLAATLHLGLVVRRGERLLLTS
jgi:hypothetical protein